jgi:AAA+ ATPase superfamily predicted ATPase
MTLHFVNLDAELQNLDAAAAKGGLLAVYGRRRVGKTRLLIEWLGRAATVFEDFCRLRYPGAQRYWEGDVELDLVAPDPSKPKGLIVAEVKWRKLPAAKRANVLRQLQDKWSRCQLAKKYADVRFEALDAGVLEEKKT